MKKNLIITFFILFLFKLQAQNTSFTLSTGTTVFYSFNFYEDASIVFRPGFDAHLDFPLIKEWYVYSGLGFGLNHGGFKHKSDDVTYNLDLKLWHISSPLYFRFENPKKWHPRAGVLFNVPLKYTSTYDIFDNGKLVYHNTDKPYKNKYFDYMQLLLGFDVDLAEQWQLDFQASFLMSANVSIGIKYLFPSQTKK